MEAVTDWVFRSIVETHSPADLYFTEFCCVDSWDTPGWTISSKRLDRYPGENKLIAQIWGSNPDKYYQVAKHLNTNNYQGIDINMGCPDKAVIKKGCCAALIDNPALAQEIIEATKNGARNLPVSVKTRLGNKQDQSIEWISFLASQQIDMLTVHGRLAKDMSKYPADWMKIGTCANIAKSINPKIKFLGNGDILDLDQANQYINQYNLDGVMIARGIFSNFFIFSDRKGTKQELLNVAQNHLKLFITANQGFSNRRYASIKKFFKMYIREFDGADNLRAKLMNTTSPEQALLLLSS